MKLNFVLPMVLMLVGVSATVKAQFEFTTNNGAITLTIYTGPGGDVVIPSSTNGYPVTVIGVTAFDNNPNVTGVTIPTSITNIEGGAFEACPNLTGLTIPDSVTTIGQGAFGYSGFTNITIPMSVTNLGEPLCLHSLNLMSITVDPQNPNYSSMNGVLFDKNQTTLLEYPGGIAGSYTISNGVAEIASSAFEFCYHLMGISIPSSVGDIGVNAFDFCTGLKEVTIPYGVTNIEEDAFFYCTNLAAVSIPGSAASIGTSAFVNCALTNVVIPEGVTSLGTFAFSPCPNLTNVALPESLTNIQADTFEECSNLAGVTIPRSVVTIGNGAFGYCTNLSQVYFQGNAPTAINAFFTDTGTAYYLPGTTGWGPTIGGISTVLWNPTIQTTNANFGVKTNRFGFTITGTTNIPIVVEACTNLTSPVWLPLQTCTVTNGSIYFSDAAWTNYRGRFYRVSSQ